MFLIDAGDGLVLVDAGLKSSPARITEAIYALGRLPQDVVAIVVTHTHRDHVGGLAEMKRRTGAEVWMHPADAALVRDGLYGRPFGPGYDRASRAVSRAMNLLPPSKGDRSPWPTRSATARCCPSTACAPYTRPATPPATWPCCCRARAACCSSATPPRTCCTPA